MRRNFPVVVVLLSKNRSAAANREKCIHPSVFMNISKTPFLECYTYLFVDLVTPLAPCSLLPLGCLQAFSLQLELEVADEPSSLRLKINNAYVCRFEVEGREVESSEL